MESDRLEHAQVQVLGRFEAVRAGEPVRLGGRLQCAVLARLLIADAPVDVDQLAEDVWQGHAPNAAPATVHAYVSRLRKILGGDTVCRGTGGYRVDRSRLRVDAWSFEQEVAAGQRAWDEQDVGDAAEILSRSLSRWTGEQAFGPLRGAGFLDAEAHRLEELRLHAVETLADAHDLLGRQSMDIGPLRELVDRWPLRESAVLRLMRALYAVGRQADALAAYDRCRRVLADELGVDPCRELRELYAAVLAQQDVGSCPQAGATGPVRPGAPRRLPPPHRAFIGREQTMHAAAEVLDASTGEPRVLVLYGLGGVGKSELARQLAHARRSPDTVSWWVRADSPAATATGLADLARALGITGRGTQEELLSALWDELATRPWLIVFDNAEEPDMLEAFLPPAGPAGSVVVTSRNPAWRRLGTPLPVPPFSRDESVHFLTARSGDHDPVAAHRVAELLGDLPLALEHACAYVEHVSTGLGEYADLLLDRQEALMTTRCPGTLRPPVAATWEVSAELIRRRSPHAAGLLETAAFLAPDAIPLSLLLAGGAERLTVNEAVAQLLRFSLLHRQGDLLRMHRLVQVVVRARLNARERGERLGAAIHLVTAAVADGEAGRWDALFPHTLSLSAHTAESEHAARLGPTLVDLLVPCAEWLAGRALFPAALDALRMALRLAQATTDRLIEGRVRSALGETLDRAGDCAAAHSELERAVALLADVTGAQLPLLAHAYDRLGHVLNCAGDTVGAIEQYRNALRLLRATDQRVPLARVLTDLGYAWWASGELAQARGCLEEAIVIAEAGPDRAVLAHALAGLGLVEQDSDHLPAALACQTRALRIAVEVHGAGHPAEYEALDKLGYLKRLLGDVTGALQAHERAVTGLEAVFGGADGRLAMALSNAGLTYRDAGRHRDARAAQQRAYDILFLRHGADHPSTQLAARRLGVALAADGSAAAGQALAESALRYVEASRPAGSPEVARACADLALVADEIGDHRRAGELRRRARDLLLATFGPEHHEVRALADTPVPVAAGGIRSTPGAPTAGAR
ncbi:BTAD domain-containing putative transcriptional regulator [Couchioplanes azureus]|uniref:BTAD domain-containing putative transcriptional regulator n=1 Tax=Couchioplanes caeruleus TaxID=56438 RepID=UPI00166F81E2|nr:BTAD domain-containing putative transcriptional regulator [Couchioplanes caeruleus]GGQ60464.1 SARP family transcriptional regulator [Couchioplanes caeruleus subsp. azureus]